jgi:hypothetical protein
VVQRADHSDDIRRRERTSEHTEEQNGMDQDDLDAAHKGLQDMGGSIFELLVLIVGLYVGWKVVVFLKPGKEPSGSRASAANLTAEANAAEAENVDEPETHRPWDVSK